jgi:high-affinity iron transporter
MVGALVIVFREVIEAGLIIGVVLAATRGVSGRGQWVAGGVVAGTLGAGIVALFAEAIANAFEGSGQELFNASVLGRRRVDAHVARGMDGAPRPRDGG